MSEIKWTPGPWKHVTTPGGWDGVADSGGALICNLSLNVPENATLIAASPALVAIVHRLCISLASAGVEAKADSHNPLEALHADALAAYEAATGIADPFGEAMARICEQNRAALSAALGDEKETKP